ncbi:Plant PDR ABC transporter associated [Dillenia turbinata]|uniref:Plant PDR ABC transporter associated n=1 Tax=Dillenia turbinata TaxID=194707 RepID=A0AAN8ZL84_9MAGN
MWNSLDNVFSGSSSFREEPDEEEALRWAALERLPTYARARRGIFKNLVGESKEIDVSELGLQEQKLVLDRLVSSVDEDAERFFDRMRKRFDAECLIVFYKSFGINVELQSTFCVVKAFLRQLHLYPGRRRKLCILDDVSGIVRPSRLTLLLGPPSCGKTTLLLALAGRLDAALKALALGGQETSLTVEYILKRIGHDTNVPLGKAVLRQRSLFTESYWYWIGIGAMLGYIALFNILLTISLSYLNPWGKRQAVVAREEHHNKDQKKKDEQVVVELGYYLQHSASLTAGKSFNQRGMVLPFQPLSMSFSNIKYYVDVPVIMPIWWRWYYWANPIAWSLYGLLTSQYGDVKDLVKLSDGVTLVPVQRVLRNVFGYRHDYLGIAGIMVVGFCMMFAVVFAFAVKSFNFQKR